MVKKQNKNNHPISVNLENGVGMVKGGFRCGFRL